ncbi:MAG: heavy metal translocating P-type ATPase [Candidatus Kariarchaeaceae archaeon]|jgi:Cd2+/Zn2+-exporting ATPase
MNTGNIPSYEVPIPWIRILGSVISFISLISLYLIPLESTVEILIYLIGAIIGGWFFYEESFETLIRKKKVSIDMLMTLAIIGSAYLGALEESLTIVFLYSITETLESYSKTRTRLTIKSLMKLVPKTAIKLENQDEISIKVEDIEVDDILLIKPGDSIPVDGVVSSGNADIDESSLTGESIPVLKEEHDGVFAGTICNNGVMKITVTKIQSESTVSKIISLVEEAQTKKTPTQLIVSKFTRRYNPFIIVMLIFVFVIPVAMGADADEQLQLVVTLIVASAPCALAIATPVSVSAAIGSAGKKGILVKGGTYLQTLGEVNAIAFDKTGTLTFGNPTLSFIKTIDDISEEESLRIAGSLEKFAYHPIAKSIIKENNIRNVELYPVEDFTSYPGGGISGIINNSRYYFGNIRFLNENINGQVVESNDKHLSEDKIISYLFDDTQTIAEFAFDDKIKPESVKAITELQARGIEVFMLTGDKSSIAQRIGNELNIRQGNIFSELTPQMKMEKIEELKEDFKLAMVGDGINDAPALALADLGVAMGIAGTDVALETADIAIMGDNLENLVESIQYGKKMKRIILQNIIFSAFILSGLIIGVLFGLIDLNTTIIIHEGSEVLIVGNAFRLLSDFKFKSLLNIYKK